MYRGVTLKLLQAAPAEGKGVPGTILQASPKEGLVVAARDGAVSILTLQAPGKRPMAAADYLRGNPMAVRTAFDPPPATSTD